MIKDLNIFSECTGCAETDAVAFGIVSEAVDSKASDHSWLCAGMQEQLGEGKRTLPMHTHAQTGSVPVPASPEHKDQGVTVPNLRA